MSYSHRTGLFKRFDGVLSSGSTGVIGGAVPSALYLAGHFGKDSYAKQTALLAGEAYIASAIPHAAVKIWLTDRRENEGEAGQRSPNLLECDQHFRPGVPFFYVSDGLGGLRQRVASVDHRGYFSGLDQSAEGRQVVS